MTKTPIWNRAARQGCTGLVALAGLMLAPAAMAGDFKSCGTGEPCAQANSMGNPGCSDADCCNQTCDIEPFCCEVQWDALCAAFATDEIGCAFTPYDCGPQGGSPPANDCCTDPQPVTGTVSLSVDTTNANTDGPEAPECNSAMNDLAIWRDRWYLYEAPGNGGLNITNCLMAEWDSKIAAYGPFADPGDVQCAHVPLMAQSIECNEDCSEDATFFTSTLNLTVQAGMHYLIRYGGYLDEHGPSTLDFNFTAGGPANDDCADAIEIVGGDTPFNNIGGTTDGPPHTECGKFVGSNEQVNDDVWFVFEATTTAEVLVSLCGQADFDTKLAIYDTGDCGLVGDGTLLGCDDDTPGCEGFTSELTVPMVQGNEYLIRVGGFGPGGFGTQGTGTISIGAPPPPPDPCTLDTSLATVMEDSEPCMDNVSTNGGCNSTPANWTDVTAPVIATGKLWANTDGVDTTPDRDQDWYRLTVSDPDGDGEAIICYSVLSEIPTVAFVIADEGDDCVDIAAAGTVAYSEFCTTDQSGSATVAAPGTYSVFVSTGNADGSAVFEGFPCGSEFDGDYMVCINVIDDAAGTCPATSDCFPDGDECPDPDCQANLNGDAGSQVNAADLAILLGAWSIPPGSGGCGGAEPCCANLNGDAENQVNAADLAILLGAWSIPPGTPGCS